jgi:hypothetical protein
MDTLAKFVHFDRVERDKQGVGKKDLDQGIRVGKGLTFTQVNPSIFSVVSRPWEAPYQYLH